ncbi:phosphoribosylamine--glycine ligase [bacterium]|jgi:phosphoribosylamine--glycine ligase|nr:phosphoribosylamine--glycine ligase [bacterium]
MKVLVVGSGGREHALVWKLSKSNSVSGIYCAPGNGGISALADCIDIAANDIEGLLAFAKKEKIDFTVVGPEAPLVSGIVDIFEKEGLHIFGPVSQGAKLEGSKAFSKIFMRKHGIPTAEFQIFDNSDEAADYIRGKKYPLVVKADGLAAGKGVFVCASAAEAEEAAGLIMKKGIFGKAGREIVVEECLKGEEASILAFCDGNTIMPMDSSQDHKRIFDGDKGPNTGGMGAYSPAPVITGDLMKVIDEKILQRTIRGLKKEGIKYKGVIYAGIMVTDKGPMVLEYNVRFGDPETQPLLMRMKTDLMEVIKAVSAGDLNKIKLEWDDRAAVCVVMASGGYPGRYDKGFEVTGLEKAGGINDVFVFHAGTRRKDGRILTSGGRVIGVTALGNNIEKAVEKAYNAAGLIKFEGVFFRKDIGHNALAK